MTDPPRWRASLAMLGFLLAALLVKLAPWYGLAFLGPRSVIRELVAGGVGLALTLALTAGARRLLPAYAHRDLVVLPRLTARGARLTLLGLALGAGLLAAVYAAARLTGGIVVQWRGLDPALVAAIVGTMVGTVSLNAAWEELTFRGWPFSVGVKALGPHAMALGLGTVFGLLHLVNPTRSAAGVLSVALAGTLICYAMLASRHIMLPLGLHVGWNLTQSLLTSRRLWQVTVHASVALSGGPWGLEASVAGIVVTAAGALAAFAVYLQGRQ